MKSNILFKNVDFFNGEKLEKNRDIEIRDGKFIISGGIGQNLPEQNEKLVIDGKGKLLSAGFIDVHTHADIEVFRDNGENLLSQGVTTIIGGNCGISAGVDNGPNLQGIISGENQWGGMLEYWNWLSGQDLSVNYATLAGHHTIETEAKLKNKKAEDVFEELMQNGYVGMSTGLVYGEGKNVNSADDLVKFGQILTKYNGVITSHVKDQGAGLLDSVKMFTDLQEIVGSKDLKVDISHLKHMFAADPKGHETLEKVFELIEAWQSKGFETVIDAYPYNAGMTTLNLPGRYKQCVNGWDDVAPVGYEKTVGQMAKERGVDGQVVCDELVKINPSILAVYHNTVREEDMWEILNKDYCWVGSDGIKGHPRYVGTFPLILRKVIDSNWSLEKFLKRMTSAPADFFGINKGRIMEGEESDWVLIDLNKIRDNASYEKPDTKASGVLMVGINGETVYKDGAVTGLKSGKLVCRKK